MMNAPGLMLRTTLDDKAIYESTVAFKSTSPVEERLTFAMSAENVPVGARISFSSDNAAGAAGLIALDWTTVTAPGGGGAINPSFHVGLMVNVPPGYATTFTYRTDFNGYTPPPNFQMHMMALFTAPPG